MKTETETFDIAITFAGAQPVKINDLTRAQMEQVKDLFRHARGERSWNLLAHRHAPSLPDAAPAVRRGFLTRLWRRVGAWMTPLLLVGVLSAPAMAQAMVKAVEPARVSFADDGAATVTDREFNELLRQALNERATVRFTSARFDYRILTATAPITSKGQRQGFAVAVGVMTKGADSNEVGLKLHVAIGPTLDALAKDVGGFLDKELQRPRRR